MRKARGEGQGGKRRQVVVNRCQEPKKVQGQEMMFVKNWYLSSDSTDSDHKML